MPPFPSPFTPPTCLTTHRPPANPHPYTHICTQANAHVSAPTHKHACTHTLKHKCAQLDILLLPDGSPAGLLRLELWHGSMLLGCAHMLLLEGGQSRVLHEELQRLPWAVEGAEDVADFVVDLGHWQRLSQQHGRLALGSSGSRCGSGGYLGGRAASAGRQADPLWAAGAALLRQAVLWGMSHTATHIYKRLSALPAAPATPLACLAQALGGAGVAAAALPAAQAAAARKQERGGTALGRQEGSGTARGPAEGWACQAGELEQLGGLLHLALLSPAPAHMLATMLGWGGAYGRGMEEEGGATGALACAWRQRNGLGLSALEILGALEEGELQAALGHPHVRAAVLEATTCVGEGSTGAGAAEAMVGELGDVQQEGGLGRAVAEAAAASKRRQPCQHAAYRFAGSLLRHLRLRLQDVEGAPEASYRAWVDVHCTPMLRTVCWWVRARTHVWSWACAAHSMCACNSKLDLIS